MGAIYVHGRITLVKLRAICDKYGFTSFMFKGRLVDLTLNLHDFQHQVIVITPARVYCKGGNRREYVWPDDFRRRLEQLPDHFCVRVEADRAVPRIVVLHEPTAKQALAIKKQRALDRQRL